MAAGNNILNRLYIVVIILLIFAFAVGYKILDLRFTQYEKYKKISENNLVKDVEIPANRGNVYSLNGNLLATSIPRYQIRLDAVQAKDKIFKKYIKPLSDSLSKFTGKSATYHYNRIVKARVQNNKYLLLGKDLSYSSYKRLRSFPLLNLGALKGGLIVEQATKRVHPMGSIGQRTIGYERIDGAGNVTRPGIDGTYGDKYLKGINGKRKKQKIGNGNWKPIVDYNQQEPVDGYDVYTTIDVNFQDITHHALLKQLELYNAEHGCAVIMEVETGEIRAISNLGKTKNGNYYEKRNYAIWESQEPGSSFKTVALMAALEQGLIDTTQIVDTKQGKKRFYGRIISDSKTGGYGKISIARALEVSSNIGLATLIDNQYKNNPNQFIDQIKKWHLHKPLGLDFKGEGSPRIYAPGHSKWSKNALPSMAYGYNLQLTPLQMLVFYNAIANQGTLVKPRFLKSVKSYGEIVESFDTEIIDNQMFKPKTLSKIQKILENVVVRGTGKSLHSTYFSMAGKTGTARKEYWKENWEENKKYISSFVGYFPAKNPKYSCIVVIHNPSTKVGYYGADVSGPVFKRIAEKVYTNSHHFEYSVAESYKDMLEKTDNTYEMLSSKYKTMMPNVKGMPAMDAMALLENLEVNIKVKIKGEGIIKTQSIQQNTKLKNNDMVVLEAI